MEYIPQVPGNRPEVGQNHDSRNAGRLLFQCSWPSGVSLESPRLENIPQVPGNRGEIDQNQDARKAVSATVSVLK